MAAAGWEAASEGEGCPLLCGITAAQSRSARFLLPGSSLPWEKKKKKKAFSARAVFQGEKQGRKDGVNVLREKPLDGFSI